ncbi:hypothetical protein SALBM135S_08675 [Streptomyces alboniger]
MVRMSTETTGRPVARASAAYRCSRALLPIPPGPCTTMTMGVPGAPSSARRKRRISSWRPTKFCIRAEASLSASRPPGADAPGRAVPAAEREAESFIAIPFLSLFETHRTYLSHRRHGEAAAITHRYVKSTWGTSGFK